MSVSSQGRTVPFSLTTYTWGLINAQKKAEEAGSVKRWLEERIGYALDCLRARRVEEAIKVLEEALKTGYEDEVIDFDELVKEQQEGR